MRKLISALLLALFMITLISIPVKANVIGDYIANDYITADCLTNDCLAHTYITNDYLTNSFIPYISDVIIEDDAKLLASYEEDVIRDIMQEISVYGKVAFKSISKNSIGTTSAYASDYYHKMFGTSSGILLLIDMDNRYVYIYSDGAVHDIVTKSYANIITDNIYKYLTQGDYLTGTYIAFEQILALLKGQKISQPMKYISNALISVIAAMLINYFIAMAISRGRKPSHKEVMNNTEINFRFGNAFSNFTRQTRQYSPRQRSSGGGGRSGGGGGRSGGGGGHRF